MKDRQHALIDRFFTGDLSEEENQEFQSLMKDKAFSNAVGLQQRLRSELMSARRESPLGQLLAKEGQKASAAMHQSTPTRRILLFSAAATVLLLLCTGLWYADSNYGNEALAERFHQPIYDDTQAGVPDARDLIREAKRAFFQGDFQRAEVLASAISASEVTFYQQAQALKVYALFNQRKYDETIVQINQTLALVPLTFSFPEGGADKLRWTRMLAHVGAGKEASSLFKDDLVFFLNGLNESYRKKAEELDRMLNSNWRKFTF